jgi:hypothetical protein
VQVVPVAFYVGGTEKRQELRSRPESERERERGGFHNVQATPRRQEWRVLYERVGDLEGSMLEERLQGRLCGGG